MRLSGNCYSVVPLCTYRENTGVGVIWISKLPAVLTRTCATNVRAHQQRSNLILLQKYSIRNYWVNNSLELVDYVYELVKQRSFNSFNKITLNYYFFEILILNHILFFSKLILQTRKRCACCLKYWNFFLITVKVPWSLILFS